MKIDSEGLVEVLTMSIDDWLVDVHKLYELREDEKNKMLKTTVHALGAVLNFWSTRMGVTPEHMIDVAEGRSSKLCSY